MKKYIQPVTACIRLNLSSQVLDYPMGNDSRGAKKGDAWAKSQGSFNEEGWDDENEGYSSTMPEVKWEEE